MQTNMKRDRREKDFISRPSPTTVSSKAASRTAPLAASAHRLTFTAAHDAHCSTHSCAIVKAVARFVYIHERGSVGTGGKRQPFLTIAAADEAKEQQLSAIKRVADMQQC